MSDYLDYLRDSPPITVFLYWVRERESIRLAKEAGRPKPWTPDPILRSYRFCNVRRMDDRVSTWLLEEWYEPFWDHSEMLSAVALARFVNLPETLEEIGFPETWNPDHIKETMRARKERGERVFNGAYMVRGNDGVDKASSVVDYYIGSIREEAPEIFGESMQEAHSALLPCYGMGSFMAGQICADLYWAVDNRWEDTGRWAPIGPGSKRGMNRLLGRSLKSPLLQDEFTDKLGELMTVCRRNLSEELMGRIEAMDFQNCLCEFDKYCRALYGEGKPKQQYPGGA